MPRTELPPKRGEEGSRYRDAGHDPTGCDLVVCWVRDWPDCPLEVLAL